MSSLGTSSVTGTLELTKPVLQNGSEAQMRAPVTLSDSARSDATPDAPYDAVYH